MLNLRKITVNAVLGLVVASVGAFSAPVQADEGAAFLGGIAVARISRNVRERNEAEQAQAYYAQQQAQAAQQQAEIAQQQAQSSPSSGPEEQLRQLNNMLQQGYITQAEYDAKKKEILDNM